MVKGLAAALKDIDAVDIRLGRLYGFKRISKQDYESLTSQIGVLRKMVLNTEELEGFTYSKTGDPNSAHPYTPERLEREGRVDAGDGTFPRVDNE